MSKQGRPKTDRERRTKSLTLYVTPSDGQFLDEFARDHGFRSTSSLLVSIAERLVMGGMSGVSFCKLGWQFATLIEETHKSKGTQPRLDFLGALRPLPPLIGDEDDPKGPEIVPFLEEVKTQLRKEIAV